MHECFRFRTGVLGITTGWGFFAGIGIGKRFDHFTANDETFDSFPSPGACLACFIGEFANPVDGVECHDGGFDETEFVGDSVYFGWWKGRECSLVAIESMQVKTCEFGWIA